MYYLSESKFQWIWYITTSTVMLPLKIMNTFIIVNFHDDFDDLVVTIIIVILVSRHMYEIEYCVFGLPICMY